MAFAQNFTISITSDPSAIAIADISTGADGAITDRQIILYKADNSIFGTFDFPLSAGLSITINPLVADLALNIKINWNNSGAVPLYTKSLIYAFTGYAELFYYGLTQQQQANPLFLNDQNYFQSKSKLRTLIDSAIQAINVGNDIFSANISISLYQIMLNNPTLYF
jgi:hypothetical protein